MIVQDTTYGNGIQKELGANVGFAHQLSHKISQTFGNPTIVHRPNLRSRPSLLTISNEVAPKIDEDCQVMDLDDAASPISYKRSGSASMPEPSTAKTSLESTFMSPRSMNGFGGKERVSDAVRNQVAESTKCEKGLTPILEVPSDTSPSLVTVETTANAKIFLETHFNSLLANHTSPRSLRRRQLEQEFLIQALPEEQRQFERLAWAHQESHHLRAMRSLKSSPKKLNNGSKVGIAGYQVVRVLGKGSFGVVRLVREKDPSFQENPCCISSQVSAQGEKLARSGESNGVRLLAVGALRSTFDFHKGPQFPLPSARPKEVFAMKVIRKSDMLRNCQEGHLRAERDFLVASEHSRWVVPLLASFQDHTNLYLVMEYMVGGDFLGLLFRKNILKEKHAKWYIAEMILCVEETHRSKWIHRDIKPDNFLISSSGHLKISDFGLAFDGHWAHDQKFFRNQRSSLMEVLGVKVKGDKDDQEEDDKKKVRSNLANVLKSAKKEPAKPEQFDGPSENETILQWRNRNGRRKMAASIVGTSQYMAPEVIRGDAYDGRCDWWSIGIILYEVSNLRLRISLCLLIQR